MKIQEIIEILNSIKKDAEKMYSGNVMHQRTHIIATIQYLIDRLNNNENRNR